MGLLDLFRSYFPAFPRVERLGANDLPQEILDDFRKEAAKYPSSEQRDDDHVHRDFHQGSFNDVEREFENAFNQMDRMFQSFFGGGRMFGGFPHEPIPGPDDGEENGNFFGGPHIEFHFGDDHDDVDGDVDFPHGELPGNSKKSLREKMLDGDGGSDMIVSPFQGEEHMQKGGFGFNFGTPFFGNFRQSPFGRQRDGHSDENEDQDLDKQFENGSSSIDEIINSQKPHEDKELSLFRFGGNEPVTGSNFFKSSSVTRKMNPDGSIETISKKRDSEGNEEIVTSRVIGERTHTVTSKKNNTGEEEKIESFVNMDENDLEEFEKKWNKKFDKGLRGQMIAPEQHDASIVGNLPDLFSSWWKPKL